jgi:hypothetical protein
MKKYFYAIVVSNIFDTLVSSIIGFAYAYIVISFYDGGIGVRYL